MIYTVTFNPSLDYIVTSKNFTLGRVNRANSEKILPGGKGINVSIVLKNLGFESTALGFIGGFTGDEIEREVKNKGCFVDFIRIHNGISRINMKLKSNEETELNGQGPVIESEDLARLYEKLDCLENQDILVLAGSIPSSMPNDVYEKILERLSDKGIRTIVDATGDLLMNVLKYHPFLIKPNIHELNEIFGSSTMNKEEIIKNGKKLQELGAENVLISMAGEGAILLSFDGGIYQSKAPKGVVVNSVGAGDSMVAGFTVGYLLHNNYKDAFRMGIATGSASAFSHELASKDEVLALLDTIKL